MAHFETKPLITFLPSCPFFQVARDFLMLPPASLFRLGLVWLGSARLGSALRDSPRAKTCLLLPARNLTAQSLPRGMCVRSCSCVPFPVHRRLQGRLVLLLTTCERLREMRKAGSRPAKELFPTGDGVSRAARVLRQCCVSGRDRVCLWGRGGHIDREFILFFLPPLSSSSPSNSQFRSCFPAGSFSLQ